MTIQRQTELMNHQNRIIAEWFKRVDMAILTNLVKVMENPNTKELTWKEAVDRQLAKMYQNNDYPVGYSSVCWEYDIATDEEKKEFKDTLILVSNEEEDI